MAEPDSVDASARRTVLVVDDEQLQRRLHSAMLSSSFDVLMADSAVEALRVIASGSRLIDAVVTDVSMPGMTGWDLARHAREIAPDLPVIFVTGSFDEDAVPNDLPGAVVLRKPVDGARLRTTLLRLLDPYGDRPPSGAA